MRFVVTFLALVLSLPEVTVLASDAYHWSMWRPISVADDGREKPLDTLATETLRSITGRDRYIDPQTTQELDATAWYVSLVFDWQGWDHPNFDKLQSETDWRPYCFHLHKPDKWDHLPLLCVALPELRSSLELPQDQRFVSPAQLAATKVEDRETERAIPFSEWAEKIRVRQKAGQRLTQVEQQGLQLAEKLWAYQNLRMGRALAFILVKQDQAQSTISLAQLLTARFDAKSDGTGDLRDAQALIQEARAAFRRQDQEAFDRSSRDLCIALRRLKQEDVNKPHDVLMVWEVAYNRWAPIRCGCALMAAAAGGMLLHVAWRRSWLYAGAVAAYVAGMSAIVAGMGLRITFSGRPPVTNMYESVVFAAAAIALSGFALELVYARKHILTVAALLTAMLLALVDSFPVIFDARVRPLAPLPYSYFFLVTHVLTMTLGLASLTLAMGMGSVTLVYYLTGRDDRESGDRLSCATQHALRSGVLLMAIGMLFGAVWADRTWGRFWGWDPKEVWTLITILVYLAILAARARGWIGQRGLAALSVACFSLVVMAWYGVNCVLKAGLHTYGFGDGRGQQYVFLALAAQLLFVGVAWLRSSPATDGAQTPLFASR